ncbi:class I SAM-dependent rRNA methyltransferase [Tumebacillus flagellatus]|uniref:SAM-dependent methyltransferase n=1 Tax=Tumebacillus flagellatus TaxID=1157490 RepID=A0A074LRQ5_9BACL|nr:class I SAM-dependent rRNA methyltransferase [Tumebacillus flagellatus]KEO83799.1 SAM-dependent methyltransferase [Tumebacillus flagellatus]
MATIILNKKRKKRLEAGNPWVFNNEIDRMEGEAEPGEIVDVHDHRGAFLARGYYNPKSQITVRVMTYTPGQEIDQEFFTKRVQECYNYRRRFVDSDSFRLIYGEADFLPGLVVDKFADVLVLQILSLGMEVRKELILNALKDVLNPKAIYERSDVSVRKLEGLEERTGLLHGELEGDVVIEENGLKMLVDVVGGQKTGYFFDQRENRASIRDLVKQSVEGEAGKASVLECFSHTGSFTVHAAAFGAQTITTLDISEHAIDTAIRNVELNGFEDKADFEFVVADAFEQLREWEREKRQWDVVILDPPAFAKNKGAVPGAIRGYKEINLRGMKLVKEGGFLVTASCSYHMHPDLFLETIADAALDARKILRLVEYRTAGKDHPKLHGMEENNYLKFAVFEVRSRR